MVFMDNIIGIPTGPQLEEMIYKKNIKLKEVFGQFNINGIELSMIFKSRLYNLKLDKIQLNWLKNLDYVSIHAPWKIISEAENKKEITTQMDKLYSLYDKTNAKMLIIHPEECPYDLLDNYDMNYALENMPKKSLDINSLDYEEELKKIEETKYGFCLDVSHSYDFGPKETERLFEKFKNKLKEIHLSGTEGSKHHMFLIESSKKFLESLKPILKTKMPLILEINFPSLNKEKINKEIAFVKELFK
jgi:hypothetical protein